MNPKITLPLLRRYKQEHKKFCTLTAYDASFARLFDQQGIEVLLVGDSLGMVLQGHDSTLPVSLEHLCYHTQAVKRGSQNSFILADLPFMSYCHLEQALDSSRLLMQAGAHGLKLEGGAELAEIIQQLTRLGVPVCAHLGLTPQSVNLLGGYRVQGREPEQAARLLSDARQLYVAGAQMLLLECVPRSLAKQICDELPIPVIGIGAGPDTDSQVLVMHDLLGLGEGKPPRFVRDFLTGQTGGLAGAISAYANAVRDGSYPNLEQSFD